MTKNKGKKKKKKDKLDFADLVQRFKSRDYAGAERNFKNTAIKPHEKAQALQLRAEIADMLAYQCIENHQFAEALEKLASTEALSSLPNMLATNQVLKGMAHLYLLQWDEAAAALASVKEKESTAKFYFYYLLALLYAGKYNAWEDFEKEHGPDLAGMKGRGDYLKATYYMVRSEWDQAAVIVQNLEPLSEANGHQLSALRAILQQKQPDQAPDPAHLSALYKALLQLSLSEEEMVYLEGLAPAAAFIKDIREKRKSVELRKVLESVCEKGIPVDAKTFNACLPLMDEDQMPYIVYSQAACLYNKKQEVYFQALDKVISENSQAFFKVPESIFLYLESLLATPKSPKSSAVYQNIDDYLSRFGKLLPASVFEHIGWQLLQSLEEIEMSSEKSAKKKMLEWLSKYPSMRGLMVWLWQYEARTSPNVGYSVHSFPMFSEPVPDEFARAIIKSTRYTTTMSKEAETELIPILNFPEMKSGMRDSGRKNLEALMETFIASLSKYPPAKENSSIVLEIFEIIAGTARFGYSDKKSILTNYSLENKFGKLWDSMLHQFGEYHPKSGYYVSFKNFTDIPTQTKLWNAMSDKENFRAAQRLFDDMIRAGEHRRLVRLLLVFLDLDAFDRALLPHVNNYLTTLAFSDPENVREEATFFFNEYKKYLNKQFTFPKAMSFLELLMKMDAFAKPEKADLPLLEVSYLAHDCFFNEDALSQLKELTGIAHNFIRTCIALLEKKPGYPIDKTKLAKIQTSMAMNANDKTATELFQRLFNLHQPPQQ